MINKLIVENIYSDILELSKTELQIEKWIKGTSGRISSYTELMCRLFDDNGLDEFVEKDVYQLKFSKELIDQLVLLRDMLNNFDGEGMSSEAIISNGEWKKIVSQAGKVLTIWNSKRFDGDY